MSDKSHVAMLNMLCPVCAEIVESNILLDKRLRKTLDPKYQKWSDSLCPACAEKRKEYVHLVEVSNAPQHSDRLKPENSIRTGRTIQLRIPVFCDLFQCPEPKEPYVFCDNQLIDKLLEMSGQSGK